jgi:hypothetical protein
MEYQCVPLEGESPEELAYGWTRNSLSGRPIAGGAPAGFPRAAAVATRGGPA